MNLILSTLQDSDRPAVVHLLENAKLPVSDLPEQLPHFFKAEINGILAGIAGLEIYNDYALLRSVAVDQAYQNQQIGKHLYEKTMQHAKEQGVAEVYLITTTAEQYFAKHGFVKIERSAVPAEIQQTQQFQGVCPSSATIMRQQL
jgi:amino-acid N-acetyltransferase